MNKYYETSQPIYDYVSNSKIKLIMESPRKYYARYAEKVRPEETAAMRRGRLIHELLLQPEEFAKNVVLNPYDSFRTNAAKEWREKQLEANPNVLIVSNEEMDKYTRLRDTVLSDPMVRDILDKSTKETHGYAVDPESGMTLYSRPDIVTHDGIIADLKTVADGSPNRFINQQFFDKYYMQLGFYNYVHGIITGSHKSQNAFYIVVEDAYPHVVQVYTLSRKYEEMALRKMREGIDLIKRFKEIDPEMTNKALWYGYADTILELDPTYGQLANEFPDLITLG